jgi:hypothetical protein
VVWREGDVEGVAVLHLAVALIIIVREIVNQYQWQETEKDISIQKDINR